MWAFLFDIDRTPRIGQRIAWIIYITGFCQRIDKAFITIYNVINKIALCRAER